MIDLHTQWTMARKRSVPLLGIISADPAATLSWIQLSVTNDTPIVQWDSARGLLGVNQAGGYELLQAAQVESSHDLMGATLDPVNALGIALKLPRQAVAIFLNLSSHWHHPEVAQAVWNCRDPFKTDFRTLLILAPDITPPAILRHDLVVWEEPLPTDADVSKIAHELYEAGGLSAPDEPTEARIYETVRGLPAFAAEQAIALSLNGKGVQFDVLWHHKRRMIENTRGLYVYNGEETFDDIVGLEEAKDHMRGLFAGPEQPQAIIFMEEVEKMLAGGMSSGAGDSGVAKDSIQTMLTKMEQNKWTGFIAVGPAGSGKSLISQAIGKEFGVPTIGFDLGATRDSLVGASEQAIRACFRTIEAIAGQRAYWVATCNDHTILTPELKRRFTDGVWYFGMPDDDELAAAWRLQRSKWHIPEADEQPTGVRYTFADVRNICRSAYRLNMPLKKAAQRVVPVSVSDPASITRLEEAAHNRFLSASHPGVYNKDRAQEAATPVNPRVRRLAGLEA